MKKYDLQELLPLMEKKLENQGLIADGQVTPKGWELFMKQWRAWKATRPN
jgi:hypothetical protein